MVPTGKDGAVSGHWERKIALAAGRSRKGYRKAAGYIFGYAGAGGISKVLSGNSVF